MDRKIKRPVLFIIFLAGWYLLTLTLSYIFYPDDKGPALVDTRRAYDTIFQDQARYVLFNIQKITGSEKKKIFLIGDSNVREGFRPGELMAILPDYEVHNLSISGSDITQMEEMIRLLRIVPRAVMEKSVIVTGIWYASFIGYEKKWASGKSHLVDEASRYGLYLVEGYNIRPAVDLRYMPYLTIILRPCLIFQAMAGNIAELLENLKTVTHTMLRDRRIDLATQHPALDEAYKDKALKFWRGYIGTEGGLLKKESFEAFLRLCRSANESGARLVIVDMPLPEWHRERSASFTDYQDKKGFYIDEALRIPRVRYLDMNGGFMRDSDFYDSAHPVPAVTKAWSARLSSSLKSF